MEVSIIYASDHWVNNINSLYLSNAILPRGIEYIYVFIEFPLDLMGQVYSCL